MRVTVGVGGKGWRRGLGGSGGCSVSGSGRGSGRGVLVVEVVERDRG